MIRAVSRGEDVVVLGACELVHHNPILTKQTGIGRESNLGFYADTDDHQITRKPLPLRSLDCLDALAPDEAADRGVAAHFDAGPGVIVEIEPGYLRTDDPRHHPIERLEHRDLKATGRGHRRCLQADVARPDHDETTADLHRGPDRIDVRHGAHVVNSTEVGARCLQSPDAASRGQQQAVVLESAVILQRHLAGSSIEFLGADAELHFHAVLLIERQRSEEQPLALQLPGKIFLRQRRALIGGVAFLANDRDPSGKLVLSQGLNRLGGGLACAHDDKVLRHGFVYSQVLVENSHLNFSRQVTDNMTRAIRIEQFGGPEIMQWVEVEVGEPGPGEARVAHTAIGINFIDTYRRSGLYPVELPSGLGTEASGVVVSVGADVDYIAPGDRVAYAMGPQGSYSEERVLPAKWLVKLPEGIDEDTGAAMLLKGLTSWYLLRQTYRVEPGEWILLYAAAGGVGLIAAQWARQLGAHVIGVVSTEEKRQLALAHGCETVLLADEDIVGAVRELTGGAGLPVVYDPVGKDTVFTSLDCLRPRGLLVSFGNASGPVECLNLLELAKRGSLYVTRPVLASYVTNREELEAGCAELFEQVRGGHVAIEIGQRFPLSDAAEAHRALEARRTSGSTLLVP